VTIPNQDGWTPLIAAARRGYSGIVELLLENVERKSVLNFRPKLGCSALFCAAASGHSEVVSCYSRRVPMWSSKTFMVKSQ
jgi:ankyrin repeat protein